MSDAFNPYAEWLGLANVSSRPNHYTLLGLELYASDPAQIKQAADRAVTRVRGFRPGDKARFWATLLDEIDVARKCLGDDAARRDYDAQLRTQGPDLGVAEKSPTGFAAGAAPQKTPSNPAMYPPGMGGPLPERYGPAGPAPDDAPQQLASSMTAASGASRFAPGYAGTPAPAATATPQQSIASPGTLSMPRKLPMGRDQNPAASPDPMAPVYGMQPQGDPMAPVGDMNSGYSAQPYGQPMTAQPASPAGYGAASYGAAAYGGAMQPVTAVQLQSGAAMAPVAMPVGGTSYDSSGYSAANAGYGNGHAGGNAGGAYGQGASAWGNASAMSTAAMPIPVASASSAPQVVAVGGKPSSNAQKNLMLGLAAVGLLVVGGLISYLVMGGHQPENDNEQVVASVGPDAAGETPVTTTPDDDPPQTPDTTPTTPEPQPEPQPEVTPPPQPEPEKTPSPEPTPEPAPEPVKEPDPPMPQPEPEPEPQPPPPMITPQEKAALKKALVAARQAMTDGDLEAAREQLAEAEKLARSDEHIAVVERTKELEHYLSEFWSAFDKAYAGLQPTNTITIDTAEAAIVEVRPDALVIKWFGRNRTIPRQGMPAGLVMAIANEWFDDQPANKVVKGAYYFVNNKPDKAEQMWSEAGDSGVPVKSLMKVLDDDYEL